MNDYTTAKMADMHLVYGLAVVIHYKLKDCILNGFLEVIEKFIDILMKQACSNRMED